MKEQSLVPGEDCKQQQSVAGHEGWLRSKQLCWVLCQVLYSLALHQHQPGNKAQGQAEPGTKGFVCSNAPNPAVPAARMGWDTSSSAHTGGEDLQAHSLGEACHQCQGEPELTLGENFRSQVSWSTFPGRNVDVAPL